MVVRVMVVIEFRARVQFSLTITIKGYGGNLSKYNTKKFYFLKLDKWCSQNFYLIFISLSVYFLTFIKIYKCKLKDNSKCDIIKTSNLFRA